VLLAVWWMRSLLRVVSAGDFEHSPYILVAASQVVAVESWLPNYKLLRNLRNWLGTPRG
jgi:hypothetical protein